MSDTESNVKQMKNECARCGDCCRRSSPTLMLDDLFLLRTEKLPWNQLVTLRKGEPAFSPHEMKPVYLPAEKIKIREKKNKGGCVFLDQENNLCTIYEDRPQQCRAQECWNPESALAIESEEYLTRKALFAEIEVLLEILDRHDEECSFKKLREGFERIKETKGQNVDGVIEILSRDDHFRDFVPRSLSIPLDILDLVFGRSLASRVGLFGFRIETSRDGTHTLVPGDTPEA